MTKCHNPGRVIYLNLDDSFISSTFIEGDEGPGRNSRAGLPSASPGPVFFPMALPHSNAALPVATQELKSFPGRELVPHLAFPAPGVVPDVDTTELVPDIIVPPSPSLRRLFFFCLQFCILL